MKIAKDLLLHYRLARARRLIEQNCDHHVEVDAGTMNFGSERHWVCKGCARLRIARTDRP